MSTKKVTIYTDGSCLGNPGPGGYAAVLLYGSHRKEVSQGYQLTTNNRMEILAAIAALSLLKHPVEVQLYTDSQYVKQGIQQWITGWKLRNWRTSDKKPVKNKDLWQQLDALTQQHHVDWYWVKAHNGDKENERCDQLAKQACSQSPLLVDSGYHPS